MSSSASARTPSWRRNASASSSRPSAAVCTATGSRAAPAGAPSSAASASSATAVSSDLVALGGGVSRSADASETIEGTRWSQPAAADARTVCCSSDRAAGSGESFAASASHGDDAL